MSAHKMAQVIDPVTAKAWPRALSTLIEVSVWHPQGPATELPAMIAEWATR
jgi:hypothetical protein